MDKLKTARLYDYYGGLLTEHQSEILRQYFYCDMSLSEIAELAGTTKQGVYEVISRSENKLLTYEKKLGLIEKVEGIADYLEEIISGIRPSDTKSRLEELLSRIKEI